MMKLSSALALAAVNGIFTPVVSQQNPADSAAFPDGLPDIVMSEEDTTSANLQFGPREVSFNGLDKL